jgi:hypothetical protein
VSSFKSSKVLESMEPKNHVSTREEVEGMQKKEFMLLIGLLVLVAVFPGDVQSASPAATGTPDNQYQALIGEWRGWFGDSGYCRLIIHEIDIANAKARCTYTILYGGYGARSMDNPVRADFIPLPRPTIKWEIASGETRFEFVLKDNVLEGIITDRGNLGPTTFPVTIKMEKNISASAPAKSGVKGLSLPNNINIIPPAPDLPKGIAVFSGKWAGTWGSNWSIIIVVEQIHDTWGQVVFAYGDWPQWNISAGYKRFKGEVIASPKPKFQFESYPIPRWGGPMIFEVMDSNTLEGNFPFQSGTSGSTGNMKVIMKRTD